MSLCTLIESKAISRSLNPDLYTHHFRVPRKGRCAISQSLMRLFIDSHLTNGESLHKNSCLIARWNTILVEYSTGNGSACVDFMTLNTNMSCVSISVVRQVRCLFWFQEPALGGSPMSWRDSVTVARGTSSACLCCWDQTLLWTSEWSVGEVACLDCGEQQCQERNWIHR